MSLSSPRSRPAPLAGAFAPLAAVGVAILSVQSGASLAKGLFPILGAQGTAALRVGFAALILGAVVRPWRNPPQARAWPVLAAYGAALGLMNLVFYAALQRIPLGVAVAVEFTGPLGLAVLSSRRWIDFLWIALAAAGLLTLLPLWRQPHPLDPAGVVLALAAGVCWAAYIVFGRAAGTAHGPQATSLGMLVAALVVVPFGLVHPSAAMLEPRVLATGLGVAVLSSVLPYSLEMFALTRIPVRVFGVLMSLEPAGAALMAWIILREALSLRQVLAILAIMAASLGVTLTLSAGKAPPEAEPQPPTA